MKKLFLQSGKPMLGDFPEEPKWHEIPATPSGCDYEIRDEQRDEYNAAVSAAKDSAVEIVNPEAIIIYEPTGMVLEGVAMYGDDLYDLPKGWTEEIYRQDETGPGDDQYAATKARLIPLKEPESLIASQIPYPEPSGIVATGVPEHGDKFEVLLYGEWVELSENQYLQAINNNHYGRVNGIEQHRKPVSPPPQAESRINELWNKYRRMGWAHEYAENGIINKKDLIKLLKELKP